MTTPVRQTLQMVRGEDVTWRLTVTDNTGSTLNLSAWDDLQFTVQNPDTSSVLISKSLAASGITLVASQSVEANRGRLDLALASADTLTLDAGTYRYDVLGIDGDSDRDTLIHPSDLILERGMSES